MFRGVAISTLVLVLFAPSAYAQEKRVELEVFGGYTFSEGVSVDPILIGGDVFDQIDPKSGFSYGVSFDVYVTENIEVGFQWGQQDSVLIGQGTTRREFADMKVNNYHGIFTYNWGDEDTMVRPFIFGGVGATGYAPGDVEGREIESSTRFSRWNQGLSR